MSQAVEINYQQISVRCNSVCEIAESHLKELDELLNKLEKTSSRLINDQTQALRNQIEDEKNSLLKQISLVRNKANEEAKLGVVHTNNHDARVEHMNDTSNAAKKLQDMVNVLTSSKLIEMDTLLHSLLVESVSANYKKLREKASGAISTEPISNLLAGIGDETLRTYIYIAYIRDSSLSGDELLLAGKQLMDDSLNVSYSQRLTMETEKIKAELEASRVTPETTIKVLSQQGKTAKEKLSAIRESATNEIVGEKVRQESLKIIMQAIKERGFVIDKNNIKIKRNTNEVILVALKASGEKAEFRVFMDGKFIYDFHGYEGHACQKDIEPFMKDLEEVYGIHVISKQEVWTNPDKISTMKYQAINTNKNKR